jgi:hypothetical protein
MAGMTIEIRGIRVDPRLLEPRPVQRCGPAYCWGRCCAYGVWVRVEQRDEILHHAELVQRVLPPDRRDPSRWFDPEPEWDDTPPAGYWVGTTVIENPNHPVGQSCIFLLDDGRCGLQVAAVEAGMHPWALKPFHCALYPLTLWEGQLILDDENELYAEASCQQPAETARPLFMVFDQEVKWVLGEEGFQTLLELYRARYGAEGSPEPGSV